MKTLMLGLICLSSIAISCKKDKTSDAKANEFSFKYNGTTYQNSTTGNVISAAAYSSPGGPGVFIDMPGIFGGRIFYPRKQCAWLEPGSTVVIDDNNCNLQVQGLNGQPEPIDSERVYLYKSGSLSLVQSDCKTTKETDPWTGAQHSVTRCRIKGTFDLTLENKSHNAIQLTDGKVDQFIQF